MSSRFSKGFVFTLLLCCIAVLGCGKRAYYRQYVPPVANVEGIQRIAVADFDGLARSGRMVAALLSEGIVEGSYYRLFERDKLERILEEKDFNRSGHVDPETVADLKLMGVDALVFGTVDVFNVDQQTRVEKVETEISTGAYREVEKENGEGEIETVREEIKKTVWVDRPYIVKEGTVGVTFRMANINTGEIVAIKAETATFTKRRWVDEARRLPSKDAILEDLSRQVCRRFLGSIHPSYVTRQVKFEENEVPGTSLGVSFAQAGLWDKAYEAMDSARRHSPHDASTHYNVAVAASALGKRVEAIVAMEHALQLEPKDKYMRWLANYREDASPVRP